MASNEQRVNRIKDYKTAFSTPSGKRVLLDMMKRHGILSQIYTGDVNEALILEGRRQVVLEIMTILKIDEAQLIERVDNEEE